MPPVPFEAFLMDAILLLLIIIYFVRTFFKGFKNNITFKEIIKSNYITMVFFLFFAPPLIRDVVRYLLNLL